MQVSEPQTALTTCTQPCSSRPEHLPLHPATEHARHRALGPEKQKRNTGPPSLPPHCPLRLAPCQASVSPTDGSCAISASALSPEQGQSWPLSR